MTISIFFLMSRLMGISEKYPPRLSDNFAFLKSYIIICKRMALIWDARIIRLFLSSSPALRNWLSFFMAQLFGRKIHFAWRISFQWGSRCPLGQNRVKTKERLAWRKRGELSGSVTICDHQKRLWTTGLMKPIIGEAVPPYLEGRGIAPEWM